MTEPEIKNIMIKKHLSEDQIKMSELYSLPRADYPEQVGVDSKVIAELIKAIEDEDKNIHSFVVVRHGIVAAECYRAPFSKEMPHAMYSVSKSFTSAAIGIAIGEGLISLDDKVKDFFPEYTENMNDKRLDMLTVEHLLTMTSGKNPSLLNDKSKGGWIEYFFTCPWYNDPGKEFKYISENIYMLCAIITRVTGLTVREYLQPRLFEPLGIEYPFWETDENGIEAGGWGIYVKTEDIAKLMLMFKNDGNFNGRQILPDWYARRARCDRGDLERGQDVEGGYGFCIWTKNGNSNYRADGMFSQFGLVFEKEDAVFAINSGEPEEEQTRQFLWRFLPRAFTDETNTEKPENALPETIEGAVLDLPFPASDSPYEEKINGNTIRFHKPIFLNIIKYPMSMLPLAVTFMTTDKAGNVNNFKFNFGDDCVEMYWTEGKERNTIKIGMNGKFIYDTMIVGGIEYKVCSTAEWRQDNRLYVSVRPVETIGKRTLDFRFHNCGFVTMKPAGTPAVSKIADNLAEGFKTMCDIKIIQKACAVALKAIPGIVEPRHYGFIKYNK